ncbi:hypothetical protein M5689_016195 [Euphorbia peplus]|nr:hypothetical protein M5689_016195 [Euphorbia peplus]
MLQWMGGSRRKVTASRKSVQKRQKQYFEQRRRQQHQQTAGFAGLESPEEGIKLEQTNRDHRSLDILNLLNFSTASNEEKRACPTGREDAKSNASTVKHHAVTYSPKPRVSTVTTDDSLEFNQASSPPHCQVETLSPKKFLLGSPDNRRNDYNKINNNLDCLRTETQQKVSLYDLLGDDETNGNFKGTPPVHEAHVAFSVDGLGKVGTETPPSSPQQSDRFISYGCFSPLKAARRVHSPRNPSYVLNGLEHEADAMMPDVEMPLSVGCLDSLTGIEESYRKVMTNSSVDKDCTQVNTQGREVRSSYFGGKASCKARNNYEDLWDGSSSFVDTDFLGDPQCDMAWKSRPCHPDNDPTDFLEFRNDELPEYAFEGVNLHHKREASKATEHFHFLDSFSPEHQISDHGYDSIPPRRAGEDQTLDHGYDFKAPRSAREHQTSDHGYDFITPSGAREHHTSDYGYDYITPRGARHNFGDRSFNFRDVTAPPGCSGFIFEDARGSSSVWSEESCSSTAVRDEMSDVSLASSRRNSRRHHGNAFSTCDTDGGRKTSLAKENHDDVHKGKNACWSGNFTEMPVLLDSESGHNLKFLSKEETGPHGNWLFEQGYGAADMNLGFGSARPTIERKGPSMGSRTSTEDFLHTSTCQPNIDARFSFREHGVFSKTPSSGSCISEKYKSCQPASHRRFHNSPSLSKAEISARNPDFSPKSLDSGLESSFTHSSQDAFSHGDTLLSDVPENGSVSKSNEYRPETPKVEDIQIKSSKEILIEKNTEGISNSNSEKTKERTVKTMLPAKISDKSESSVDGIEHQSGDEVPISSEKENKVYRNTETEGERKMAIKRVSNCPNSSPQIMMLESFVFQLLCVQKQKVVEEDSKPTQ